MGMRVSKDSEASTDMEYLANEEFMGMEPWVMGGQGGGGQTGLKRENGAVIHPSPKAMSIQTTLLAFKDAGAPRWLNRLSIQLRLKS